MALDEEPAGGAILVVSAGRQQQHGVLVLERGRDVGEGQELRVVARRALKLLQLSFGITSQQKAVGRDVSCGLKRQEVVIQGPQRAGPVLVAGQLLGLGQQQLGALALEPGADSGPVGGVEPDQLAVFFLV